VPSSDADPLGRLAGSLEKLGAKLKQSARIERALLEVTARINSGLLVNEVLEQVYSSFRTLIPYDRIGLALIEDGGGTLTARWARSEAVAIELRVGYSAPLAGSSLQRLLEHGRPRMLNDLATYLQQNPNSESTRLIVREGMGSSLTCPLIAAGKPVGVLFFSSMKPHTYDRVHVETFQQLAGQLAVTVEKGRLYQELLQLNQLRSHFLEMASHDLRHPLTVINGYLGLLRAGALGPVTEAQQEVLTTVQASAHGMVQLIEDLLDVSAIESGKLALQPEEVEIAPYLEGCIEANLLLAKTKQLTVSLEGALPAGTLRLDAARIGQVFANLISNAVKFSHPGTRVRVGARALPGEVEFYVADEGQGIPETELPKIFTDFGRTSVRPTGNERSTGLGLSIVKRIVEAHRGRVWLTTRVGVGSTFFFALPRP
jgi:signal transduction histidine kinase